MNNRDKLVDLLLFANETASISGRELDTDEVNDFADFLDINDVVVQRWISVEDELPATVITPYLVYFDGDTYIADWSHDKYNVDWWFYVGGEYEPLVTHWMPLPEPPKEE